MKINNTDNYYNNTKDLCPHVNLSNFLDLGLPPQKAIDLGCGAGRDTIALLRNNWQVLAIDKEDTESIIKEKLKSQELNNFKFSKTVFGKMDLPEVNLVVANYSLPFTKKQAFYSVWEKINKAITTDRILYRKFFWKKRFMV